MTDARRKNTEAVLGMLPAEHVNGVKSIEFLDYDEMADAYGYRIANAEANHRSGEDGSEIALKVAPQGGDAFAGNLDQPSQQAILVHEIGHSVHTRLAPSEFGLTGEPSPLNSRIQDLYGSSDRGSLGELSESSYKEYFAEGYNHYVMYPDVLKSTDANLYNLLRDEVFDGQEYGQ